MALNCSYDPVIPTQLLDEKLIYSVKLGNGHSMEGFPDKNLNGGFGDYWDWALKNSHDLHKKKENTDNKGPDDIVNQLPSDPFGMGISATFSAITGWLEEFQKDFGVNNLGVVTDESEVKTDDRLFTGLNLVWNGSFRFYPEVGGDTKTNSVASATDREFSDGFYDCNTDELMGFGYEKYWVPTSNNTANEYKGCTKGFCDGGAPADAMFFALGYLGVRDLLSVERVCKSLRDEVRDDPLLWKSVHIDGQLNYKITDDALLRLTNRAQGSLQCLSLVECIKITDSGLMRVLKSNPGLIKLSVPGCIRLSVESIVCNLKVFKSGGIPGIKHLRIGGLFGVNEKNFEELKLLLGADNQKQLTGQKPRFYRDGQLYLSFDDDRVIDVEACPRCQQFRQVYDCPAESCQGKNQAAQLCRGCTFCIARCINCGCCIDGRDYEETFCFDLLCLDCYWKQLLNYQEGQEGCPPEHSIFHQQTRYHFCVCG